MARSNHKETRATYYGINATALAKKAKADLVKIRAKLEKMQEPWMEVDAALEHFVDSAKNAIDALSQAYGDSAEYLNEPFEI